MPALSGWPRPEDKSSNDQLWFYTVVLCRANAHAPRREPSGETGKQCREVHEVATATQYHLMARPFWDQLGPAHAAHHRGHFPDWIAHGHLRTRCYSSHGASVKSPRSALPYRDRTSAGSPIILCSRVTGEKWFSVKGRSIIACWAKSSAGACWSFTPAPPF